MEKDRLELGHPTRAEDRSGTQQQRHNSDGKTAIYWESKKDGGGRTNDGNGSFRGGKNTGIERDLEERTSDTGGEGTILQEMGPRTTNDDR